MGFGLSGSPFFTSMFQADPVITWVDNAGPHAVDYYLSGYFQVPLHLISRPLSNPSSYSAAVLVGRVQTQCLVETVPMM